MGIDPEADFKVMAQPEGIDDETAKKIAEGDMFHVMYCC
jgi:hypothetical protein